MKMEGDEGLITVERLRGRLVAERRASRVAKENAELLNKKLIELEKQLKEETKLRKIAEKKLRLLQKKLESLKGSLKSDESEQSNSSETTAVSCVSSASASDPTEQEEQKQKFELRNPETSYESESDHGSAEKEELNQALNGNGSNFQGR